MVKTLHQIWIGNEIPPYAAVYQSSFKSLHPNWEVVLWNNERIERFIETFFPVLYPAYLSCIKWPIARSDLARLCIIHKLGGLYADLDIEWFRNVESLINQTKLSTIFFHESDSPLLTNSIFYSRPGTLCVEDIVSKIEYVPKIQNTTDVLNFAGPMFLTNALEGRTDYKANSHVYFEYPYKERKLFQYGQHKNAGSWL